MFDGVAWVCRTYVLSNLCSFATVDTGKQYQCRCISKCWLSDVGATRCYSSTAQHALAAPLLSAYCRQCVKRSKSARQEHEMRCMGGKLT